MMSKPSSAAAMMVRKMPTCAAAPNRNSLGFASSGPKSIIAPMPMNSSSGNASLASMPASNSHWMMPFVSPTPCVIWSITPESGRLTRIAPKPMGSSSDGSYCFSIASQIRNPPTQYITTCCQVIESRPSYKNSILPPPIHNIWQNPRPRRRFPDLGCLQKDKQTCVFPQENAGLVISGNSQNGIAHPAMLVGAAARHAAPTTPLCLRISYHRSRRGVKRKPAKVSLRFIGVSSQRRRPPAPTCRLRRGTG